MKQYLITEEELIEFINDDNNSEYTTEHNVEKFLYLKQPVELLAEGEVKDTLEYRDGGVYVDDYNYDLIDIFRSYNKSNIKIYIEVVK